MGVNHHCVRIKVRGFQTDNGQYRPHLIAGTLGDVEDCPEKCGRCADLKKIKKSMKRSVFECHRLYGIIEDRNRIVDKMGLEEATDYYYDQLAEKASERSSLRKS